MSRLTAIASAKEINGSDRANSIERELKSAGLKVATKSRGSHIEIRAYSTAYNILVQIVRRVRSMPDLTYAISGEGINGPDPNMFND